MSSVGKEYIPLFLDFNENTEHLTDEECGRLVRAIVDYANDLDYEKRLTGSEKIAFPFLKGLVDRNAAISEKRAQARLNKNKQEQNGTNGNKTEQTGSKSVTETKTETETKTKNKNKDQQERFDRFWIAYPRHENKQNARKAFDKLKVTDELLDLMISAIEKQKQSAQWQENGGQYIPHPATWLNGHRWEDETYTAIKPKIVTPAQDFEQRDYSSVDDDLKHELAREMAAFKKEVG